MDQVKNHFNDESSEFDEIIQKLIPYYNEMVEAISESILADANKNLDVLDLGCGTGTIARAIKIKYPNAHITCLDIAENMIEMAKCKMNSFNDIEYIVSGFSDYKFNRTYDVIVSSLALHHLADDKGKKIFYGKCFANLNNNGCFYNADVVLGSSDKLQDLYLSKWIEYMNRKINKDEIQSKWMVTYKQEDHPAKLSDQLKWLQELGFRELDVIWKYYNFAVYGGRK
jgi:tRNA (cmo5U34)-methyltransferase